MHAGFETRPATITARARFTAHGCATFGMQSQTSSIIMSDLCVAAVEQLGQSPRHESMYHYSRFVAEA